MSDPVSQARRFPEPASTFIPTNGITLHALVSGEGPLLVLVHGWPELSYSWRHQIGPLAAAGYRVCAIDVRGYGKSDRPGPVEAYAMTEHMADIVGVLDHFGAERATLIGHDWGAPIVWNTALAFPNRISAVAGLSVPYFRRAALPPVALWDRLYTDKGQFFYQVYFQEEGVAEAAFEADQRSALGKIYYALSGNAVHDGARWPVLPVNAPLLDHLPLPQPFPDWMSAAELDHFAAQFSQSGFRGAFNRYRNIDPDYHALPDYGVGTIEQPSAFIAGALDPVRRFVGGRDAYESLDDRLSDLRQTTIIEGAGHWIQQERPAEVTQALLDFLGGLD